MEILEASTRKDLRDWYETHHSECREFWIRVDRSNKAEDVIGYDDAVEVALCFGWIDSTLKHFDEGKPFQRFTPRRNLTNWSELNIKRFRCLVSSGEMTSFGLAVFPY